MKPRITLLTIGVDDLARALAFYRDGLGLCRPSGEQPFGRGQSRHLGARRHENERPQDSRRLRSL